MCDASSKLLSEEKKSTLKQQKGDQPRNPINAPTFNYPDISQATAAIDAQLATTVVSKVLDRLVKTPAVAEWVKQGLSLHVDRGGDVTCQFCGNLLSKECITDLEAHFNDQYETFLNDLATRQSSLEDTIRSIDKMSLPNLAQLYDHLRVPYEETMRELINAHENLKNYLQGLTEALSRKRDKPFEPMDLLPFIKGKKSSSDKAACDRLAHLNNVIDQHNQHTKNFQNIVDGARKQLEECSVAEVIPKFCEYTESVSMADEQIRADSIQAEELRGKITELERELVQHLKPADELNHELQNFLGRGDLRLDVKEAGYTISRQGQPASNLSEGEKTAIAFLYFLKSLQDRTFDLSQGVVVIDDPVSSLDTNALFSAFGYMRERTKDAAQLFIFTHNFGFFRQVQNWFCHLTRQKARSIC